MSKASRHFSPMPMPHPVSMKGLANNSIDRFLGSRLSQSSGRTSPMLMVVPLFTFVNLTPLSKRASYINLHVKHSFNFLASSMQAHGFLILSAVFEFLTGILHSPLCASELKRLRRKCSGNFSLHSVQTL
jgi:hypothetical protein